MRSFPARRVLTARGRAVVSLLGLAALALLAAALHARLTAADRPDLPPAARATVVVPVAPGQTLWQIARELRPADDPRDAVAQIVRVNNLPSADVLAGQRVVVPLP